jgi:putative ATP-binding cassette transporter
LEVPLPGNVVWIAVAYSGLGAVAAWALGKPLIRAADRRQTDEANFRFGLVHARENAMAIALLHGETGERRHFRSLFRRVARAWDGQTWALTKLIYFSSSWSVLSMAFPFLVAAPRYIGGMITLGVLMQTAQAFGQMTAALSWPIDNLAGVAAWRAAVERVLRLVDGIELVSRRATRGGTTASASPSRRLRNSPSAMSRSRTPRAPPRSPASPPGSPPANGCWSPAIPARR